MTEPLRAVVGTALQKPARPTDKQTLACPTGYEGEGIEQSRNVVWNVAGQKWDVGNWITISDDCIQQPLYMEASMPGYNNRWGGNAPTWNGEPMPVHVVLTRAANNYPGYTPNLDISFRGTRVKNSDLIPIGINPSRCTYMYPDDQVITNLSVYTDHNFELLYMIYNVDTKVWRAPWRRILTEPRGGARYVGTWASFGMRYDYANKTFIKQTLGEREILVPAFWYSGEVNYNMQFRTQLYRGAFKDLMSGGQSVLPTRPVRVSGLNRLNIYEIVPGSINTFINNNPEMFDVEKEMRPGRDQFNRPIQIEVMVSAKPKKDVAFAVTHFGTRTVTSWNGGSGDQGGGGMVESLQLVLAPNTPSTGCYSSGGIEFFNSGPSIVNSLADTGAADTIVSKRGENILGAVGLVGGVPINFLKFGNLAAGVLI